MSATRMSPFQIPPRSIHNRGIYLARLLFQMMWSRYIFRRGKVIFDHCSTRYYWSCKYEGDGDVVGVVTPFVRGVAQVSHGDQVVELRVQLAVQEVEGKEEDREGQVEVERERRLKEKRT